MVDHRITPLLCAALGTAAGFYFLSSLVLSAAIAIVILSVFALCFFRVLASLEQDRKLQLTAYCVTALSAGLVLGICASAAGRVPVNLGIPQEKVAAIEGVLLEDPRIISGGRAIASLSLRRSAGAGSLRAASSGEITVFFSQESAQRLRQSGRGTLIFAEGRLRSGDSGYTFSAESLHVVKRASPVERMRTSIRLNLIKRFDGKAWGGLALALLVGIKDNLDTNLAAMYRDSGCSYILALSGMHLAVLAGLIAFILKKPLGLKLSALTGAAIICLYCFLVGPMPSLNRAALMYLLGVIAILGALPREPMSILALSFLIQITVTPSAGNSISFILSYLALAGIFVIGQPLYALAAGKVPDILLQPLSASVGAFLATAGVTCFAFGVIAPVGIVTGLALVPLTTVYMIGSMIWLLLDLFSISGFLNLPLSLLYWLMEKIVSVSGKVPVFTSINPFLILILSVILTLLILIPEYKRRASLLSLQPFKI
jgi:competence protein ComEC